MNTLDFEKFRENSNDSDSYSYSEKQSTNVSPLDNEDLNNDLMLHDFDLDLRMPLSEDTWSFSNLDTLSLECSQSDSSLVILSSTCQECSVEIDESLPKKRKRLNKYPLLSSNKLCDKCRYLEESKPNNRKIQEKSIGASIKGHIKRVIESDAVAKLKEEQRKLIHKDIPDAEKKRLQQMIRNRISAQQSRDRKKHYVSIIEDENSQLKSQNENLKLLIFQFETENRILKKRLAKINVPDQSINFSANSFELGN